MRRVILLSAFFISAFAFAQEASSINGILMDLESNNEGLAYAKVSIKETGKSAFTDEKGFFKIENLTEGNYTIEYSFVGYETKETTTEITSGKETQITLVLSASTVSLEDMLLTLSSSDKSGVNITTDN